MANSAKFERRTTTDKEKGKFEETTDGEVSVRTTSSRTTFDSIDSETLLGMQNTLTGVLCELKKLNLMISEMTEINIED